MAKMILPPRLIGYVLLLVVVVFASLRPSFAKARRKLGAGVKIQREDGPEEVTNISSKDEVRIDGSFSFIQWIVHV